MRRAWAWSSRLSTADRVALALGLLLLLVLAFPGGEEDAVDASRSFDAGAAALLAAALMLLLVRKRFPGLVVLTIIVLTSVWYLSGYANPLINIPTLIAFYNLGTTGDRRRQIGVGAIAVAMPVVAVLVISPEPVTEVFDAAGYPLIAMLFGEIVHSRRQLLIQYVEKAAQAEANLDTEAERRVAEDRLRIARDVHDVLAHAVAVMTVQAGVGEDALDRDPAAVRAALGTIRSSGKDAMAEMRATVAVLRGSDRAEIAPAPGLDRVPELVDGARAQGLHVELTADTELDGGGADGVESLVQLTAYRVVQESLTNVIRHARASRAAVRIERQPSELLVVVTDDGRGPAGASSPPRSPSPERRPPVGFGLRGMEERVTSLGGTLRFGWRATGGWEVVASLPTRTSP
jgi:signal transduction histidine kinase